MEENNKETQQSSISNLTLTRKTLETAMVDWTKENEGPIAYEYVNLLLDSGEVLGTLDRVATSMQTKQASFSDNSSCLIWTAWMNMQEYGTPGFPLSKEDLAK